MSSIFIIESVFMLAVMVVCAQTTSEPERLNSVAVNAVQGMCPTTEESQRVRQVMSTEIANIVALRTCGGPGWTRVAFINATNTSQTCPSGLRLITSPRRTCGSARYTLGSTCSSTIFSVQGLHYHSVCGRIIGYHTGEAYAFWIAGNGLEGYYIDGLSLTHGSAGQRQHIWSFAVGYNNNPNHAAPSYNCPRNTSYAPAYLGGDYFCESAHGNYSNPLWDGQGCPFSPGTYCNVNNPPWFNKQLPNRTSDDIELRVCKWLNNDITTLSLIELYVL